MSQSQRNRSQQNHPAGSKKKPRASPNNRVGKPFCPQVDGQFYVLGQTITKAGNIYSAVVGPFKSLRNGGNAIYDSDGHTVGYYDNKKFRWYIDNNPSGYHELVIFVGGEELPENV